MGTIVVLAVLILIVALAVRSMVRDKKAGRSPICGGSCKDCGGHCHYAGSQTGGEEKHG
ncbi:MAG: FeoB-associated Cys-rich membrane protein [Clostridiales bacterium]|nr:FeoB-associated Cys-rich membrane protein [Clostridiales bacterium]MCD8225491.1 FeoB-associated Cys-rich membrane protein [Clostridiales bacterium]